MGEAHARLGPSNHRWPHCAGSVREEAAYPDVASAAAIDGTGSHLLLENCLQNNVRAEAYDGQVIGVNHPDQPMGWLVSLDRIGRVQMALDYIARRVNELKIEYPDCDVTVESETRSNPGAVVGRDDWWGTVDITITVWFQEAAIFIEVADYKDGRGWVAVEDNSQLIGYTGGKLYSVPCGRDTKVRMTVIQPKTNPVIRYFDSNKTDVMKMIGILGEAAAKTDDPNAPLVAGKHCQWCKHKPNCSAKAEEELRRMSPMTDQVMGAVPQGQLFELIQQVFGDITQMETAKLVELADSEGSFNAVFAKVKEEMRRRIETGEPISGWAMKPGKNSREWAVPEDEVVKMLKGRRLKNGDIFPPKLISPAAVLKIPSLTDDQKKKIEEKYIKVVPGKLQLTAVRTAPEKPTAEAMFGDVANTAGVAPVTAAPSFL